MRTMKLITGLLLIMFLLVGALFVSAGDWTYSSTDTNIYIFDDQNYTFTSPWLYESPIGIVHFNESRLNATIIDLANASGSDVNKSYVDAQDTLIRGSIVTNSTADQAYADSQDVIQNTSLNNLIDTKASHTQLETNISGLSSIYYAIGNPFSFFNTSGQLTALLDSVYYAISNPFNFDNTTNKTYTDTRDTAVNNSARAYAVAQDVIQNTSINNALDTKASHTQVESNSTADQAYADSQDAIQNTSINNALDTKYPYSNPYGFLNESSDVNKTYVDAQDTLIKGSIVTNSTADQAYADSQDVIQNTSINNALDTKASHTQLETNISGLSLIYYAITNPFSFFNTSGELTALLDSVYYAISNPFNFDNTTNKTYTDTRDTAVNNSARAYAVAQDVIQNTSINNALDTKASHTQVESNSTADQAYADSQDVIQNTSINKALDTKYPYSNPYGFLNESSDVNKTYVDAQNVIDQAYADSQDVIQNTSINNALDTKYPYSNPFSFFNTSGQLTALLDSLYYAISNPFNFDNTTNKTYVDAQDVIDRAYTDTVNTSMNTYVDAQDVTDRAYADSQDVIHNDSINDALDTKIETSEEGNLNVNHSDTTTLAEDSTAWITMTSLESKWLSDTGDVLTFDDEELNGTIDIKISSMSTEYYPTSLAVPVGTVDSGNITSLQDFDEGDTLNITEVSGVPGFDIRINFTGIVTFTDVVLRGRYDGGSGHTLDIEIWQYTTGTWIDFGDITDQTTFGTTSFTVFQPENFINNTLLQFRIYHDDNGIGSHNYYLDAVFVIQGTGIVSSGSINDLLDRDEACGAFPTLLCSAGTRELTGNWDAGDYNITVEQFIADSWDDVNITETQIYDLGDYATNTQLESNSTVDQAYADSQDVIQNTSINNALDTKASHTQLETNISGLSLIYYAITNPFSFFNTSGELTALLDSVYYAINNPFNFDNTTNKTYVDAQDVIVRSSIVTNSTADQAYADSQDVIQNTSINNALDTKAGINDNEVITGNWTFNQEGNITYIGGPIVYDAAVYFKDDIFVTTEGQQLFANTSLNMTDITGATKVYLYTEGVDGNIWASNSICADTYCLEDVSSYMGTNNTANRDYADSQDVIQNTSINNALDTKASHTQVESNSTADQAYADSQDVIQNTSINNVLDTKYPYSNPFSFFNNSAQLTALLDSVYYAISNPFNFINSTDVNKTYVDAQDVIDRAYTDTVNASMNTYVDAQDVIDRAYTDTVNASMNTYVDAQDVIDRAYTDTVNASMNTYVDAGDSTTLSSANSYTDTVNASMNTYVDAGDSTTLSSANSYTDTVNVSMNTYVDAQNVIDQAYADSQDVIQNTSINNALDTKYPYSNPFSFFNTSGQLTALLDSLYYAISNPFNFDNTTNKTYVDAQDVIDRAYTDTVNASMNIYVDAQDVIDRAYTDTVNASMNTYVDAQDVIDRAYTDTVNTSMNTYVDAGDSTTLSSANSYTDTVNASMETYVVAQNVIDQAYADSQDVIQNTSINNALDTKYPYSNPFSFFNTSAQLTALLDSLYYALSNPFNFINSTDVNKTYVDAQDVIDRAYTDTVNASMETYVDAQNVIDQAYADSQDVIQNTSINTALDTKYPYSNPYGYYNSSDSPTFVNTTVTNLILTTGLPRYIWYYNETYWDCINESGTIYNRGNATVTCT